MILNVVSQYRDDFNFGYDHKCKSSQDSMLVFSFREEAVSNYSLAVLAHGWEQSLYSCFLL